MFRKRQDADKLKSDHASKVEFDVLDQQSLEPKDLCLETRKFEVLLLDLDNTFFDYDTGEVEAFEKTMKSFNLPMTLYEPYQKINKKLWADLERGEVEKEVLRVIRFERLLELTDETIEPLTIADAYTENLSMASVLFEDSLKVLKALKGKYPMVAISNGIETVQMSRLKLAGIEDFFDTIIISERIGANKPDPRIFNAALESVGYDGPMDHVLMVGDNFSADILGAKALGMKTCWMNYDCKSIPNSHLADFEIHQIGQLLGILA